jgi:hypothetical protein
LSHLLSLSLSSLSLFSLLSSLFSLSHTLSHTIFTTGLRSDAPKGVECLPRHCFLPHSTRPVPTCVGESREGDESREGAGPASAQDGAVGGV